MSLKEALEKKSSGAETSTAPASSGPEIVSLDQMGFRPQKILAYGDYKGGKTSFALSVFKWFEEKGFDPQDVRVAIIDNDDGFVPLTRKNEVVGDWGLDKRWFSSIDHALCNSFDDVVTVADKMVPALREHRREHGPESAWLVEDNTQQLWQWARDKFAMDVYGMRETTLAKRKRKEAKSQGKKMLPTYDQRADYGVINGIYGDLHERLKLAGINFIWLAPAKDEYDNHEPTGNKLPGGQKHDPGRVDNLVYLYKKDGSYYADLVGSRTANKLFRKMPNPTIGKFLEFLDGDAK